jgi:hypothetical protein
MSARIKATTAAVTVAAEAAVMHPKPLLPELLLCSVRLPEFLAGHRGSAGPHDAANSAAAGEVRWLSCSRSS